MTQPQNRFDKQLLKAAKKGDTSAIVMALEGGANIEAQSRFRGTTPLIAAAKKGNIEAVRLLLDRGANIEAQSWFRGTPLIAAAEEGHIDVVRLLLDRGACINAQNEFSETALHVAARGGNLVIFELLWQRGADPNKSDSQGRKAEERVSIWSSGGALITQFVLAEREKVARDADKQAAENEALTKAAAEREAAEKQAAEKKAAQDFVNVVIFTQKLGDLTLEDAFNFVSFERLTLVRKAQGGPVQSMTRQDFTDINNQRLLRKAFEEHVRRGGTTPEAEVFPDWKHKITRLPGVLSKP